MTTNETTNAAAAREAMQDAYNSENADERDYYLSAARSLDPKITVAQTEEIKTLWLEMWLYKQNQTRKA